MEPLFQNNVTWPCNNKHNHLYILLLTFHSLYFFPTVHFPVLTFIAKMLGGEHIHRSKCFRYWFIEKV
jgi:hypothetical protein